MSGDLTFGILTGALLLFLGLSYLRGDIARAPRPPKANEVRGTAKPNTLTNDAYRKP